MNYLHWARQIYRPKEGEGTVVASSLAFDATITSLYLPLLCGGAVSLVRDGQEVDGLEALLRGERTWSLVKISPAHLTVLGQRWEQEWPCRVRAFVIGGEALSPATVELWQGIAPQTRLINEYGPTETVVGCTSYEIPPRSKKLSQVSIGRPIGNARVYILDSRQQPIPIGVTGELYIGGAGVARGYLKRPELTAERFVRDPFSSDRQARMYKSGDLGRWRPDGTIDYLGRNDHQVKIRGFRIELGEIEAQLQRHAHVKEAVVLVREDQPGEKRLVAYVVGDRNAAMEANSEGPQDLAEFYEASLWDCTRVEQQLIPQLREYLQGRLPDYMIPSAWMVLKQLPLTTNGKVDRRALPAPRSRSAQMGEYVAPHTELERTLASIWAQVLRVDQVGIHDNFFELGGHSLLATQVVARIGSSLSIEMSVRTLFEYPVLGKLSARVEELREARLLEEIAGGGADIEGLLERVAAMSESKAQELLHKMGLEARS